MSTSLGRFNFMYCITVPLFSYPHSLHRYRHLYYQSLLPRTVQQYAFKSEAKVSYGIMIFSLSLATGLKVCGQLSDACK
jgi:hypothetical protein